MSRLTWHSPDLPVVDLHLSFRDQAPVTLRSVGVVRDPISSRLWVCISDCGQMNSVLLIRAKS
jgi:hypothetical protein